MNANNFIGVEESDDGSPVIENINKELNPDNSHVPLGSALASRAACGASPQSCTKGLQHPAVRADAEPVGEGADGNTRGACAPQIM